MKMFAFLNTEDNSKQLKSSALGKLKQISKNSRGFLTESKVASMCVISNEYYFAGDNIDVEK